MDMTKQSVPGLILVILGGLFLAEQLGLISGIDLGDIISTFWPVLLIFFGISALQKGSTNTGLVLSAVGFFFLASTVLDVNVWSLFWPLILISVGILMIRRQGDGPVQGFSASVSSQETLNESAIFSGIEKKIQSEQFKGGSVEATFGSVEIDLREVTIAPDGATIIANATFGSVEIRVPQNVRVESVGTPVLGSWENRVSITTPDAPVLKVRGSATFGSVEIYQ